MTTNDVLATTDSRMKKSVEALVRELNSIRTGRASPSLVEGVMVDYYETPTPLNQIASVSVPEARVLLIQPWDKDALQEVEKGILKSDLGLVPNNDGNAIRVNIPIPTEERRRELVKLVGRAAEDALVAIRNIRRDSLEELRQLEKDKSLSRDDAKRAQLQLQQLTDSFADRVKIVKIDKEEEVMEV